MKIVVLEGKIGGERAPFFFFFLPHLNPWPVQKALSRTTNSPIREERKKHQGKRRRRGRRRRRRRGKISKSRLTRTALVLKLTLFLSLFLLLSHLRSFLSLSVCQSWSISAWRGLSSSSSFLVSMAHTHARASTRHTHSRTDWRLSSTLCYVSNARLVFPHFKTLSENYCCCCCCCCWRRRGRRRRRSAAVSLPI